MREIRLLLRYRCLDLLRYARQHAFGFFALGPLFLGGALWIAERYLGQYRELLANALESSARPGALGLGLTLFLVFVSLGAVRRELFPSHTADHWLEILPVEERSRLITSWVMLTLRLLPAAGILLFLAIVALPTEPIAWADRLVWGLRLLLILPILVLCQMVITLLLNHFVPWRGWRRAFSLGLLALGAAVVAMVGQSWRSVIFWPLQAVALQLEIIPAQAVGVQPKQAISMTEGVGLLTSLLVWAALVALLGLPWRRRDLEKSQSSTARRLEGRKSGRLFEQALARLGQPIGAQVLRDLLLVRRRFSTVVDLAFVGCLLSYAGVVLALPLLQLGDAWWVRLAQLGCLFATLSLTGLLPWLLEHELPRFWIEKSTGLELHQIWQAKPWVARCLALPTLVIGAAILWTTLPPVEAKFVAVILPFLLAAWMIATTFGVAVFEVAERPLLSWLFSAMVGLAFAVLVIFVPMAWWLWAIGYMVVAGLLKDRAGRRIQLTEVPRA